MVTIAQLVESWIVIPDVMGSSPISHPFYFNGKIYFRRIAQFGSATGLGPVGQGFKSSFAEI